MNRFSMFRHPRIGLLTLILGATTAILFLLPSPPAFALTCPAGDFIAHDTLYYSGPKHKKIVGECFGCIGGCSGTQTDYFLSPEVCCSNLP
jgi:hypothetical protein